MKKKINILLLIIWMIIIFIMSSFTANESSNQSGFIVNILCKIFNISNIGLITVIIRKLAHFIEYFILGILTYNVIKDNHKNIILGIVFCILYALSDEIHQLFIPGRSCELLDIFIDSAGSTSAYYLLKQILFKQTFDN